jgi:hypothetical protein
MLYKRIISVETNDVNFCESTLKKTHILKGSGAIKLRQNKSFSI